MFSLSVGSLRPLYRFRPRLAATELMIKVKLSSTVLIAPDARGSCASEDAPTSVTLDVKTTLTRVFFCH